MVNKFSSVKERIVQLIEYKHVKKETFFKKISVTSANFRGNAAKTPVNSDIIVNVFTEFPDVNLEWLLTGEGEMIKNDEKRSRNEELNSLKESLREKDERIKELKDHIATLKASVNKTNYKSGEKHTPEHTGHNV